MTRVDAIKAVLTLGDGADDELVALAILGALDEVNRGHVVARGVAAIHSLRNANTTINLAPVEPVASHLDGVPGTTAEECGTASTASSATDLPSAPASDGTPGPAGPPARSGHTFGCESCGASFLSLTSLSRHVAAKHHRATFLTERTPS